MDDWGGSSGRKRGKKPGAKKSPAKAPGKSVDTSVVASRTRVKEEFIHVLRGKPFVKYEGLLDLAHDMGLEGIDTALIECTEDRAIVHAVITMEGGKTFSGYGEAHVSEKRGEKGDAIQMQATIIRIAETRAKARALRDATNVGVTAWEEVDTELEGEE